jgi:ketosteroid isomerase-like protein
MNYYVITILLLLAMPLLAQEKYPNLNLDERGQELMNVDSQFSKLSEARGVNEAFLSYLADDGVLLRPNNFPIVGKEISKDRFFSRPDSGYTLTWKPLYADIAESGELGYTYGVYEFRAMDSEGKPIIGNGTYVSIWKKDQFGNWKLVLDTGNEGLEPKTK